MDTHKSNLKSPNTTHKLSQKSSHKSLSHASSSMLVNTNTSNRNTNRHHFDLRNSLGLHECVLIDDSSQIFIVKFDFYQLV